MADQEALNRFLEISKQIHELEGRNTNQLLRQKKEQLADITKTVDTLDKAYKDACDSVAKEKADVDKLNQPSIRDFFKDQKSFDEKMSIEQEEYLEAVSRQEMVQQQLSGLTQQKKALEREVAEVGKHMEVLLKLYDEQDDILGNVFNGAYGSDLENQLEAQCEGLLERKERIVVARYKWANAKLLLVHAVKQLGLACSKWMDILKVPASDVQMKYTLATESRNNVIAASQNITSAHRYLNNIKFPYCQPSEIATLERACSNIYIDMTSEARHKHAYQCYHVTCRRAGALLQWFDSVINNTISKDLEAAKRELGPAEKRLREERLRLITDKLGPEADGLVINDPDYQGEDDFDEQEMDPELLSICQAEQTEGSNNNLGVEDSAPKAPTPLPLNELAPPPCQEELFGNIEQLKQQHERELAEFEKAQETNRARMEQGLQEKLAARRTHRARVTTRH